MTTACIRLVFILKKADLCTVDRIAIGVGQVACPTSIPETADQWIQRSHHRLATGSSEVDPLAVFDTLGANTDLTSGMNAPSTTGGELVFEQFLNRSSGMESLGLSFLKTSAFWYDV